MQKQDILNNFTKPGTLIGGLIGGAGAWLTGSYMMAHAATSVGVLSTSAMASASVLAQGAGASVIAVPIATSTLAIPGAAGLGVTLATGISVATFASIAVAAIGVVALGLIAGALIGGYIGNRKMEAERNAALEFERVQSLSQDRALEPTRAKEPMPEFDNPVRERPFAPDILASRQPGPVEQGR